MHVEFSVFCMSIYLPASTSEDKIMFGTLLDRFATLTSWTCFI